MTDDLWWQNPINLDAEFDFKKDFTAFLGRQLCGREGPMAGFASAIYSRKQQRRAGVALRPATDADCVALAASLRASDLEEISVTSTRGPLGELRHSLELSSHAVTAADQDGQIICMFGVSIAGFVSDAGRPWLFGSDLIATYGSLFARLSKQQLASMLSVCPWLTGLVDARRSDAIRYLEWLGFFVGTVTTTIGGRQFRPFNMRSDHV